MDSNTPGRATSDGPHGSEGAARALKESEERYRAVMEQSVEAIYLYDAETKRVLESNAAFRSLIGYSEDELLGMQIYDFIAHGRENIDQHVRRSLKEGRRHLGERSYRRKDGSRIIVETSASVVPREGRTALCAVSRDVTERKRLEQVLRESEERFRSLIHNVSDVVTILEVDGTVRYDSPAIECMLGYAPEERVGKSAFDYIHPEDVERVRRTFADASYSPGVKPGVEFRIRHKDGSWRHLEVTRSNLLDVPAVRGIVSNSRDVTERKQAEEALRKSEARFRAVFDKAAIGMALVDAEGRITESNAALQEMLGYGPRELLEQRFGDVTYEEDILEDTRLFGELMAGRLDHFRLEKRYVTKDGGLRWGRLTSSAIGNDGGKPRFMIGMVEDITDRKRAKEALKESEERHRAVVEQSVEGIFLFDPETKRVLESNPAFERLIGYSAEELRGMVIYDFIAHEPAEVDLNVSLQVAGRQRFVGERRYRRKDGTVIEADVSATLIPYRGGKALCAVARDVTGRKKLEERLKRQAFHDSLTGLPNRALFLDRLGHALTRLSRSRRSVAVLFADLDNFKVINDSLGHEVGNELLSAVGRELRKCVRPEDTVGRIFGDEFAVLLVDIDGVGKAIRVAERIAARLSAPFSIGEREVFVTVSIGIALSESALDRPDDILRNADLAMYAAKSKGKAKHEVFAPSMNTRVHERMELESDLRRAIEHEDFVTHFQPVVGLGTGRIVALEALARWRHPERGLVAPSEFIQTAEQTGLIVPIGQQVLREACKQALGWQEKLKEDCPCLSINLSARQFFYRPESITEVLRQTGIEPGRLWFEITERAVMDDAEFSLRKLWRMRGLGVKFAIDDYGTGYSCLYYLKRLPVDFLKIDGVFVEGLERNAKDAAIVSGTIALGHALGLKVVAEGVETAGQLALLRKMGCDLAQGFYFSEPLAADSVERLLEDGTSW